jgi:hypothetical protein
LSKNFGYPDGKFITGMYDKDTPVIILLPSSGDEVLLVIPQ